MKAKKRERKKRMSKQVRELKRKRKMAMARRREDVLPRKAIAYLKKKFGIARFGVDGIDRLEIWRKDLHNYLLVDEHGVHIDFPFESQKDCCWNRARLENKIVKLLLDLCAKTSIFYVKHRGNLSSYGTVLLPRGTTVESLLVEQDFWDSTKESRCLRHA